MLLHRGLTLILVLSLIWRRVFVLNFGGSTQLGAIFIGVLIPRVYEFSFGCFAYIRRPLVVVMSSRSFFALRRELIINKFYH